MIARILLLSASLSGCALIADKKDPGWEYAPQMYVSDSYEPYSQVREHTVNADGKNMRAPVEGTIPRSSTGYDNTRMELMYNYPIHKDSIADAARILKNPLEKNEKNLAAGKYLYTSYCAPCHGDAGAGDGLVGQKYGGVANYKASNVVNVSSGHIYHVISKGKGRMWGQAAQIRPVERWQIVYYVNQLRGYQGE